MIVRILCLISRCANCLPQWLIFALGDSIGWVWYTLIPIRRATVVENLTLIYGGELSPSAIRLLARRNFQHYGRSLLELVQSATWSKEDYLRHVQLEGFENLEPFLKSAQGGYMLTLHMGNWELAIPTTAARGVPLDVVVKRAELPRFEEVFQWYRRRMGCGLHLESGTARDILKAVAQGRWVGFVYDQFMGPPIGLPVNFMGKRAGTAAALALLTDKRDIPVVRVHSYRDPQGRNHTVFSPPLHYPPLSENKEERLFQKTQFFNDALEEVLRQHPEQWLWLHRRWKEYRGEPRWKRTAEAFACLALLLWGQVAWAEGSTGIPLPADVAITAPKFKPMVVEEDIPTPTPTAKPKDRTTLALPPASASLFDVITPDKMPFEVGERLEIDMSWMALPAGRVVIEVRPGPEFAGRPTFQLWGNALSSKLVDAVYHVDNTIESFVDRAGLIPYKFLLHMVESKQMKETRVAFDHPQKKAFYWAKRRSERWGAQDIDRQDELVPAARDMFSALYYARALNYTMGQKQSFSVYENGQNWTVDLTPVANEFVNTKVGAFQCWKLLVAAHNNNVLKPTGDIFLWLSDDSKKYIVKFDAKIKIGSLYGNLVGVREKQ